MKLTEEEDLKVSQLCFPTGVARSTIVRGLWRLGLESFLRSKKETEKKVLELLRLGAFEADTLP